MKETLLLQLLNNTRLLFLPILWHQAYMYIHRQQEGLERKGLYLQVLFLKETRNVILATLVR